MQMAAESNLYSPGMYLICLYPIYGAIMTKKKNAPLPASSAGLLRFFEDETKGFKVRPEIVLSITGALIGVSLIIRVIFPV
jgi:preprotein translocase subunit Sec61beta